MAQLYGVPAKTEEIYYPDSDDEPMAENTLQADYMFLIKNGLDYVFRHEQNIFLAVDLFWYPVEGNPKIVTTPDVFAAVGRPKGPRDSYQQWLENNQPPDVIFEIWSPGNRARAKKDKFDFYQKYGVREYYTYNPYNGELAGWLLRNGKLVRLPLMEGWVSPALKIRFELDGNDLKLFQPDGEPFVDYTTMAERAGQERAARERAELRVQQERDALEQLRAKLRQMNIDPDKL